MKRTAIDAELADPGPFVRDYFRRHDMDRAAECDLSRQLVCRAEEAREEFKRIRLIHSYAENGATTGEQKYNRRLINNRNSAAASRVFREVLKKEQEYGLMRASSRAKKLEIEMNNLREQNKKLVNRIEQFNGRQQNSTENIYQENIELRAQVDWLNSIVQKNARNIEEKQSKCSDDKQVAEDQNATDPSSPITNENSPPLNALPPLRLGSIFPALFCASQNEKDIVFPRSTVTPRESISESQEDGPLGRREPVVVFGELGIGETPHNLRLSINSSFPGALLESHGNLQFDATQDSQMNITRFR